jgi:hypothetical protein
MMPPSVKGTIFQTVVDELNEYLRHGILQREDLAARWKPDDLAYLDQEISIASWYPIDTYGRYLRFLCNRFGDGRREYLMEGGRQSARRVVEMGVYGQLDDRTEHWGEKVGRVLVTLGASFYNFGKWTWEGFPNDAGFRIEVQGVTAMPEECALRAHGFVEYLASRSAGCPVHLEYRRPKPSQIIFIANRPDPGA